MKVNILCVGKLKEDYYVRAQAEYVKMLGRFCDVNITEVADCPLHNVKSDKETEAAKVAEGKRLLEKTAGYMIACDGRGKKFSSETFSQKISDVMVDGNNTVTFIVGGSVGLADELKRRADLTVSFSEMTMPHRLFRIVLLEQVYRAFKIMNGEAYHK